MYVHCRKFGRCRVRVTRLVSAIGEVDCFLFLELATAVRSPLWELFGGVQMMKVHISRDDDRVILRVEGRVAQAYVAELERCWREACALEPRRHISLDLRDVTCVDHAGGCLLRLMRSHGVEVVRTNLPLQDVLEQETGRRYCGVPRKATWPK